MDTIGQVIAEEVRRLREARRWSQQDLADRLSALGAPLNRVTVTKIESGGTRAANLSVADLLALAAALDTSPVSLVFPAGRVEEVEVTPGLRIYAGLASQWFCAEEPLSDEYRRGINRAEWKKATLGTRLFRETGMVDHDIGLALRDLAQCEYVGDETLIQEARSRLVEPLETLATIYREMDDNGITPPGVRSRIAEAWESIGIEVPAHWRWEPEPHEDEIPKEEL